MSLSQISIKRPVLATVMSIIIVLFGAIGYTFLGVREYPSVDPPIITVSTNYTGANADVMETQITEPLEESINGIAGIRSLKSVSRDGRSTITVEFNIDVDLEAAANDVRDRVSRAERNLPPDTDPPTVSKADADASPIAFLNVKSETRSLLDLSAIAENVFKERLQTIDGVSEIRIWGQKRYSMRLWLNQYKLAAFEMTPLDVREALNRNNVELPTGRIEGQNTELTVRTLGRLTNVTEFNDLIIKQDGNGIVRLKDVGRAELFPENERTLLKRDKIPMVGVVLIPQPGANYIEIVDEFYRRIELIKKDLPADIEIGIGFDQTTFIRQSIDEVVQTVFIAFGLVIFIIFFFLRDWRTTIIPVIVIPIALIGSFFIMYLFNFSINVLTLLGIVLAIGLVVDDAIVVLENIYKKIELGMSPKEAGVKGTAEIFFAVIATTIALASVFMPILFLEGLTGRLFREFGIVIAGAVIISSFVALTLTPMLATKILKKRTKHNKFYEATEPFFVSLTKNYASSLDWFMERRWLSFPIIIIAMGMIYIFGSQLPSELAPVEDRSSIRVLSTAPEGTSYDFMELYMNDLVDLLEENISERRTLISITSPGFGASSSVNSGFVRVMLLEPNEREASQKQVAQNIQKLLPQLPDARSFVIEEQSIGASRGGLPVQYVLQAPNLEKLQSIIPIFMDSVMNDATFAQADVNLKFNKPELQVDINRMKARDLGLSIADIAQTLQLTLSGARFDFFVMDGKQYQVIGQLERQNRNQPLDLKSIYVRNNRGDLIQLDNVVTVSETSSPPQLFRFDRFASATISASLAPGKTIADGINVMERISQSVLDETMYTSLDGPSKDYQESASSLVFIFALALILIYLVLSAQFESFRDPFIIMFTVPLAIGGAIFSLWYFGQTINIFSQIGQIMLIGLVTKNGILIVEFANQIKARGNTPFEAAKLSAYLRFRPILMTSFSTILGILPIALAIGAGSESRRSMGIAVIGGLVLATLLTLYVIPAIYSYFSGKEAVMTDELKEADNLVAETIN
jgi:multidrug efflux pump